MQTRVNPLVRIASPRQTEPTLFSCLPGAPWLALSRLPSRRAANVPVRPITRLAVTPFEVAQAWLYARFFTNGLMPLAGKRDDMGYPLPSRGRFLLSFSNEFALKLKYA